VILAPALLRAATGCTAEAAERFAPHLDEACRAYGIDTFARYVAFLAQIGHESGSLRHVREIWGPTPAQQRYEGRADLGNVYPGDGQRYMGRGLIQTTGRHNYRAVRDRLRTRGQDAPDFERDPDSLESPKWAAWSAADYWDWRGLNALADRGDFEQITRRINGGLNGHADRLRRLQVAREALAEHAPQTVYTPAPTAPPAPPLVQPGPEPSDYYAPSGEAPEWVPPPPKEKPMAPFIAAALPAIVQSIPQLAKLFGSGSEVAQRNIAAAETVVGIVQQAVGASNAQEAAELVQSDPQARQKAQQAVESQWYTLTTTEAGGGGIGGARQFAVQAGASSPQVWRIVGIVTYAALGFLLLANVIAMVAWGVAMWRKEGVESATQILVQVIAADILSATSAISFWLGSSFGSRQKDEQRA
jgi:putative chitinase